MKKKSKREAKTLQDKPKPIFIKQKPPTTFEKFKEKLKYYGKWEKMNTLRQKKGLEEVGDKDKKTDESKDVK